MKSKTFSSDRELVEFCNMNKITKDRIVSINFGGGSNATYDWFILFYF